MKKLMYLILLVLAGGMVLTWRTQTAPEQTQFLGGSAPDPLPDGFWSGDTTLPKGAWLGKRFDAAKLSGVNMLKEGDGTRETAPFKLSIEEAIWDKGKSVMRVDYNLPENPFYLRPAIDEIVALSDGTLLGKIHYRLAPTFSIAIGYFTQKQGQ